MSDRPNTGVSALSDTPLDQLEVEAGVRPVSPRLPDVSEAQRRAGGQLAAIHRLHLRDMGRLARLIARIEVGEAPPAHLAEIVLATDMARNLALFGTLCGQECRALMFHHNAEEAHMFPELEARAGAGVAAVVARLRQEHEVVHELLHRLAEAAGDLAADPDEAGFARVRAIFERLHAVVRSHFRYEETELEEAIGVHLGLL